MNTSLSDFQGSAAEARDARDRINTLINTLEDAFAKENSGMQKLHSGTETAWENEFNANWNSFNSKDVPAMLEVLRNQAANLDAVANAMDTLDK